jgi:Fe(3+) dicitrate transport protein
MQQVLFLSLLILGFNNTINAQQQDSTYTKHLQAIIIDGKKPVPERLLEIEGTSLFSGKKNEVIRLANIDANLVTNNSRQIFARVPGVSIWENDGSGVQVSIGVRGLSPNRSWEFNNRQNGYDISSDVFGYPEAYYNPPMEAVEKIQIIRGGASLQYGSQFGGLLNYQLKRETQDKPFTFKTQNTIGSYGLFSSFNTIGGNTKKWNYNAYNHYRKGNGWRENGQYTVRNSHAFVQYKWNAKNSISAEYTNMNYVLQQSGGLTDEQFATNHQQSFRKRNWFSTPWHLAAINIDNKITDNLSFNIKLFGLIGQRNSIGFLAAPTIKDTINNVLKDYNNRQVDRDLYKNIGTEIRGIYSYTLFNKKQHIAFGARVYRANTTRKQRGKGDTGSEYSTSILSDKYPTELVFQTDNVAFFAENQVKLTNQFSITPGCRYENIVSDINGRINISGNNDVNATPNSKTRRFILGGIGLEYKLKTTNFYANISQAFRPILFSDITPPATTDIIDTKLKDATGFNSDFGYRGSYKNILSFDVGAFYIQYNNRIGTIRKFIDNNASNATYQFRTNLGKSSNKGIEAYIDVNICPIFNIGNDFGDIHLFTSLAFVDASYHHFVTTSITGTAPNIIIKEDNLKGKKVEYAPSQIHNIGITFSKKGISTTLQTRLTSDVFTDATNTETTNAIGTIGKIKGYQVVDISAEYNFLKMYSFRCSVNNFTNAKYATRRSGGFPGPGLIPGEGITCNVGIGVNL